MALDLLCVELPGAEALLGLLGKEEQEQVLGLFGDVGGDFNGGVHDVLDHRFTVFGVEWGDAGQHFVNEDAEEVPVDGFSVAFALDHFWSKVGDGATKRHS